jgi:hypothetical protein
MLPIEAISRGVEGVALRMAVHEFRKAGLRRMTFAGGESARRNSTWGMKWGMGRVGDDRVFWDRPKRGGDW